MYLIVSTHAQNIQKFEQPIIGGCNLWRKSCAIFLSKFQTPNVLSGYLVQIFSMLIASSTQFNLIKNVSVLHGIKQVLALNKD